MQSSPAPGTEISVHQEVTNNTSAPLDVMTIAAQYNTDGILTGAKHKLYRIEAKNSCDCKIDSILLGDEFDKLKIFVWEADFLKPIYLITNISN